MEKAPGRRSDQLDEKWRRAWWWAAVVSVAFHVVVLLLFRSASPPLPNIATSAAGPRMGDPNAAEGGGLEVVSMTIAMPPPTPAPIPEPPEPVPVPEAEIPVEVEEQKPAAPTPSTGTDPNAVAAGGGQGEKVGPGIAGGTGQGDGGNAETGLYRITPPTPRGLILPPSDRPGKVKGREVVVYVFVSDRGRVVSDSTRLAPTSGDAKFDDRLRRQAAEWVFSPARRAGEPIAEWFKYTIVL